MTRRSLLPQSRRHIFVYDEDWSWLSDNFGILALNPRNRVGVSFAIREIIHRRVRELRAQQEQQLDQEQVHEKESVT